MKELLTIIFEALKRIQSNPEIANVDEKNDGIEIEKEHMDLYAHIKEMCGETFIMTPDAFAEWIEKAHHREDKDYYKKLWIMGL